MNSFDTRGKIQVLIISGPDPVGDWMASTISLEPDMLFLGLVRDISQAVEAVKKLKPDVILLDISSGILEQGDLINRLAAPLSGAAVIAVAMMGEVDAVRQAMLYGAQGFLLKPFSETELLTSVRRAYDLIRQRRAELAKTPRLMPGLAAEPQARAEIVAVFSPKGGVGCTTIAINLAVALKLTTGKPVILVDADLRFGDIDAALNITSTFNIATLLPGLGEMDDHTLNRALVPHSSGIRVLIAPPYLDMADEIRPEQLSQLLTRLASLEEGYVVVDIWSSLDDCSLALLDVCQHLVVLTTPQVTALRDTHRLLELLKLLNYAPDKTKLVLNNCYQRSDIKLKDVERILGKAIAQTVDYAPNQVTATINRGMPLVLEYGDSAAAQSIFELAQIISNEEDDHPGRRRLEVDPAPARKEPAKRRRLFSGNHSSTPSQVRT
jgi:pilus assembly protein CpaE